MLNQRSELPMCAALTNPLTNEKIRAIHSKSGHPGIQRTTYFVQRQCLAVTKAMITSAVRVCEECCTADPAPGPVEEG